MKTFTQVEIAAEALADWTAVARRLQARFEIPNFERGGQFVAAVSTLAEQMDHHPEITLTHGLVEISTVTHDAGDRITVKDIDLARSISVLAKAAGLTAPRSKDGPQE